MKNDKTFMAKLTNDKTSGWTCVKWPESVSVLGTGRPVKVTAVIEGCEFQATFLPIGGMHMLPVRAAVMKTIDRQIGDTVEVYLKDRQS